MIYLMNYLKFVHITGFGDKSRIRVCKNWYNASGGAVTRYSYREGSEEKFGSDLEEYPILRQNIRSLVVVKEEHQAPFDDFYSDKFMEIVLPLCSDLANLTLKIYPKDDTYVKKLNNINNSTTLLPRLQQFDVHNMKYCKLNYVDILNSLRDSLTHLELRVDTSLLQALYGKNMKFDGFISSFGRLNYLHLKFDNDCLDELNNKTNLLTLL